MLLADEAEKPHVLNQQGVDTSVRKLTDEFHRLVNLIVVYYGVDGYMDFGAELMGIAAQSGNIVKTVASRRTRSKMAGTNVDGIGTTVYGGYPTFNILRRSEEFERSHRVFGNFYVYGL